MVKRLFGLLVCLLALLWLAACSPSPSQIHVEANGSGDYATLEEAAQNAPDGAEILLGPGIYRLETPFVIRNPVRLIGAGMDQTTITSEAGGYVLLLNGNGPFAIEDIAFRYEGQEPADVVIVSGGEIAIARCSFTGAKSSEEDTNAGLRIQETTTGTVQNCIVTENDNTGILVDGEAQPTLEGNTCSDNTTVGIALIGSSSATVRQNTCTGNGLGGILAAGSAQPTLTENICDSNGDSGIVFLNNAAGTVQQNSCSYNSRHGIIAGDTTNPELIDNDCQNNGREDILDMRE